MVEIRGSFGSVEEWDSWRQELGDFRSLRQSIVQDIRNRGLIEPFTGMRRHPHEIVIRDNHLHETVSAGGLNSRKRALLVQLQLELRARGCESVHGLRILSADGISRVALILRGLYPYFLGTEYLPTPESLKKFFPMPHMDLQDIGFEDNSFDVFISGDVFEHIPDLDHAINEILRVLKPGGIIVASFPFNPNNLSTKVKASINENGTVVHHSNPEYHQSRGPKGRSLVFQLPGWDSGETAQLGRSDAIIRPSPHRVSVSLRTASPVPSF
jgi:hypothetical protein